MAGLLAGWLLVAACAYRMRERGPLPRAAASTLSALAIVVAVVPAYEHYRAAYQVMMYAQGSPYPYVVDGPHDPTLTLACTGVGLIALAAALLVLRSRRLPPESPQPA